MGHPDSGNLQPAESHGGGFDQQRCHFAGINQSPAMYQNLVIFQLQSNVRVSKGFTFSVFNAELTQLYIFSLP